MFEPEQYFTQGVEARTKGLPKEACPMIFKAWPEACWQLGWEYADICANVASGNVEQEPLQRILKRPFDQGQIAFMQQIGFDDCPYSVTSPDGYNWQAGWIAGEEAANPAIAVKWNWPVIGGALTLVGIAAFM